MRGFTLIEVLVTTLIMSIIMAALFMTFSIENRSWFTGDATIELRDQVIRAIMTMDKDLSEGPASGVNSINLAVGASSNSVTFWLPDNSSGSVVAPNGNIQWTGPFKYSLNNATHQVIRSFGVTNWTIANDITSLQFLRQASRIIQVNITAQKKPTTSQQITDNEQAEIKIRN